jgi:hypothetical protein
LIPGYFADQIDRVIEEGPRQIYDDGSQTSRAVRDRRGTVTTETMFDLWEYHGEVPASYLAALGCPCGVEGKASAWIIIANDTIIKAEMSMLDTQEFPYDVMTWEKRRGNWDGYGVSFLCRTQQRVLTAAYRLLMDNAGQANGPQIVVNKKIIDPANGRWEINGRKLWWMKDGADVRQAFMSFQIDSQQSELVRVIDLAHKFLDDESSVPTLAQGEQGTAPDTVGVTQILSNNMEAGINGLVKIWDDGVLAPHIIKYVDWNMQYSDKPEIKGDFEVRPKCSALAIERDLQNQSIGNLFNILMSPAVQHMTKPREALRRMVQAAKFDPSDFVLTDSEIDQKEEQIRDQQGAQKASPDAQIRAESAVQVAKIREDAEMQRAMIQRDIEMLRLANQQQISLEKIKAQLAGQTIDVNSKREDREREIEVESRNPEPGPRLA